MTMAKKETKVITHIIYFNDYHEHAGFDDGAVMISEDEKLDICIEKFARDCDVEISDIPKYIRVIEVKSILIPTPGKFTYTEVPQ